MKGVKRKKERTTDTFYHFAKRHQSWNGNRRSLKSIFCKYICFFSFCRLIDRFTLVHTIFIQYIHIQSTLQLFIFGSSVWYLFFPIYVQDCVQSKVENKKNRTNNTKKCTTVVIIINEQLVISRTGLLRPCYSDGKFFFHFNVTYLKKNNSKQY